MDQTTPSYVMGGLCIVGGLIGFAKTRSLPSIVAGSGVGSLYLWSATKLASGEAYGLEGALAASLLLFFSSVPRFAKAPVPKVLTLASAITGTYYANVYYNA
ncbi:transmembrane proteins 14C-domain-containing protein [Flagelloscypha sp. PMI_526]|nr:transmembrane proteins 14C-domain-containing protein [Flagelloscypha sp. PMI_526]